MPQLQLTALTKSLCKRVKGQIEDKYIVSTPKGVGTVLFSDPIINEKIPVAILPHGKFLIKEEDIEVIGITFKNKEKNERQ